MPVALNEWKDSNSKNLLSYPGKNISIVQNEEKQSSSRRGLTNEVDRREGVDSNSSRCEVLVLLLYKKRSRQLSFACC